MASNELRKRENWQTISGAKALAVEDYFKIIMESVLNEIYPNVFKVEKHPRDFEDIYSNFELSNEVLSKIYNVDVSECKKNGKRKYNWGIKLDFVIRNIKNNKNLYGEIKRQDGWVETTEPSAGRGNAHERSCKYFTPGLLEVIRKKSNISSEILPFWIIFVGDITRDPKRNREVAFWFQGYEGNYFMWRNTDDVDSLIEFFEKNLLKFLL